MHGIKTTSSALLVMYIARSRAELPHLDPHKDRAVRLATIIAGNELTLRRLRANKRLRQSGQRQVLS